MARYAEKTGCVLKKKGKRKDYENEKSPWKSRTFSGGEGENI
jgi:hypothetical protein